MNGEASRHSKSHHHHGNRSHHREEYDDRKDYEEDNARGRRLQDAYDEDHIDNH